MNAETVEMLLPGFLPDQPSIISVPNEPKPETLQVSQLTFCEQSRSYLTNFCNFSYCYAMVALKRVFGKCQFIVDDGRATAPFLVDILLSRNSLCHLNTNGRLTECPLFACSKSCLVSVGLFPRLTQNLIKTCCSSFDGVSIVDVLSRRYYYNDLR